MRNKWRRFEILLPLQFNDGRDLCGGVGVDWRTVLPLSDTLAS